ncbi:MAG: NAD(+)/NADH kinase, partial [Sphingobium sp.]
MMSDPRLALVASPTDMARDAERRLRSHYAFVAPQDADIVIALGGDGFMLQTLHQMLETDRITPVFGMNLGTVGFLMNEWRLEGMVERLSGAKPVKVTPLRMRVTTVSGEIHTLP